MGKRPRGFKIKGRTNTVRRIKGKMNGLETAYANLLKEQEEAGEIVCWWYEGMTFKLAQNTTYTPDFVVLFPDGTVQLHETKGGLFRDAARVKTKCCAEIFPFSLFVVRKAGRDQNGNCLTDSTGTKWSFEAVPGWGEDHDNLVE